MGVVHLAYDPELDRRVAIKLLHDTVDDDIASARLRREAQAMAKLAHPNVVAVFDVGEYEGALFVAMEYVQGGTLGQWLREPVRSRARCSRSSFRLGVRSRRRIPLGPHRDFKPDNAIVDDDGRARVLDFGLARPVAEMPTRPMSRLEATDETQPATGDRTERVGPGDIAFDRRHAERGRRDAGVYGAGAALRRGE